jgi:hypothetical protein
MKLYFDMETHLLVTFQGKTKDWDDIKDQEMKCVLSNGAEN